MNSTASALKSRPNALLPPARKAAVNTEKSDKATLDQTASSDELTAQADARATRRNEIIFMAIMLVVLALIAFVILSVMNGAMGAPPSLEGAPTP